MSLFQTYYGVDVNAITDRVRQKALKTMIETYGQTPQQLFNFPHSPRPQRKQLTIPPSDMGSMTSLNTLKFMDTDPAYSGLFSSRLSVSLSSDTGTIASCNAATLTGNQKTSCRLQLVPILPCFLHPAANSALGSLRTSFALPLCLLCKTVYLPNRN